MKKRVAVLVCGVVAMAFVVSMSGCAHSFPTGAIYTNVIVPHDATGSTAPSAKVGTSESMDVLSLVAIGDSSIETAAKNGGITKIHHVDWECFNILGIFGQYKAIVYGD